MIMDWTCCNNPCLLTGQSAIVGILGEMTLLRYFQQTENRRPDIETVAADLEADRLAVVEKLLAEGKVGLSNPRVAGHAGTLVTERSGAADLSSIPSR